SGHGGEDERTLSRLWNGVLPPSDHWDQPLRVVPLPRCHDVEHHRTPTALVNPCIGVGSTPGVVATAFSEDSALRERFGPAFALAKPGKEAGGGQLEARPSAAKDPLAVLSPAA